MALHQVDFQFYLDDVAELSRYYWSQTWYNLDSSVNTTGGPSYTALINFYAAMLPEGVWRNGVRARRLEPTFHDYGTFSIASEGTRPASSPFTLTNVARVRFMADGEHVGYKRMRLPLQYSEIDGQLIEGSFITLLADKLDDLMVSANLCNWRGVRFNSYRIEPEVHMWQLRHGTNRRSRAVL